MTETEKKEIRKCIKEKVVKDAGYLVSRSSSLLTRREFFKKMIKKSFHDMDRNDQNSISQHELYTSLLMIQLKLAKYAGPAACQPPSKKVFHEVFVAMDYDHSGDINEHEYTDLMIILCSQIATRIVLQWTITIFFIPFIARQFIRILAKLAGEEFTNMVNSNIENGAIKSFTMNLPFTIVSTVLSSFGIPFVLDHTDLFYLDIASLHPDDDKVEKKND